jgi:hypothetical protein
MSFGFLMLGLAFVLMGLELRIMGLFFVEEDVPQGGAPAVASR